MALCTLLEQISKEDQFKAPARARSLSLGRHFANRVGFVSTHQVLKSHTILYNTPRG